MYKKTYNSIAQDVIRKTFEYAGIEPLNEMAPPPRANYDETDPLEIHYDFQNQPTYYFKVYDNVYKTSKRSCRIALKEGKYMHPHHSRGKKPFELDNWQVDWLIEKLKSKPEKGTEKTLFEYIINEANKHNKQFRGYEEISTSLSPDQYIALKH